MEGRRIPAMGPRETYDPLFFDGFGDHLTDRTLRSWLWKERSMVSRPLALAAL
jgi:hypothetical protein